ncbi:hypothetical protein PUN28_001200 [Cardiocondyla obscurior]|uniref:Ig-like domain-containing protein n=1 Tax=Cardiocondyla obscurior TaxID=286306 RepID=A0AAW2H463_9HYME
MHLFMERASCLREVSLEMVPEVVQRGEKVILRCHYDLENAPLYSLKWYRGKHEFYRFAPTEEPSTKVFNISGINVDVQATARQQRTKDDEGMQWSEISLTLHPYHYANGRLNLRCIAHIPGIYTRQSELQLLSGMREPVPERVTSENGSDMHTATFVTILCLGTLHLLWR